MPHASADRHQVGAFICCGAPSDPSALIALASGHVSHVAVEGANRLQQRQVDVSRKHLPPVYSVVYYGHKKTKQHTHIHKRWRLGTPISQQTRPSTHHHQRYDSYAYYYSTTTAYCVYTTIRWVNVV